MMDFDDIWQKYSKYSRIEFACFCFRVFVCFFYQLVFQTRHRKWCKFWKLHLTLPVNMAPFSKEDKILIKSLYECKYKRLTVYKRVSR